MSIWIIGDLHGCSRTFEELLSKLPENDKKCLVGDLIDRGPNSRAVLERVIKDGIDCVAGNHEYMMLAAMKKSCGLDFDHPLSDREAQNLWLNNGGYATLDSFTVKEGENEFVDIDTSIMDWMLKLPLFLEYKTEVNENGLHLMVSHAGASKRALDWKNPWDEEHGLLWHRDSMYNRENILKLKDIYQIFGHTPQKKEPLITDYYACIDMGTYYRECPLIALKFPEMEIVRQEKVD